MTRYLVYDVFTDQRSQGNQLAIVPDARHLPDEVLGEIAREFNYSETTFVYPPQSPEHTARVRIFTPSMEVPFAGHPVIGTAIALSDLGHEGDMVLELGVGPTLCRVDGDRAAFVTQTPLTILSHPDPTLIAKALGLSTEAIKSDHHGPVQAGVGLDFVLVELNNLDDLNAIQTNSDAFARGRVTYPAGLDFAIFAYVREGQSIDARMFAPLDGIPEDPATGSACAALGALLFDRCNVTGLLNISQGRAMGRLSAITVQQAENGIEVSGQAICSMVGELRLY